MASSHQPQFRAEFLLPRYWSTAMLLVGVWLLWLIPGRPRAWLADHFAGWACRRPTRRRQIALENLALCLPSLSAADREQLWRQQVRIMCQLYASSGEFVFGNVQYDPRRISVEGLEHCDAALACGHNVILLTPHWLAYEFVSQFIHVAHPLAVMVRVHRDNPALDWLVSRFRYRTGAHLYSDSGSMLGMVRDVRDGRWLLYLPDEDDGGRGSFVPFFGIAKSTTLGLHRLCRACAAVVVPVSMAYCPDTRCFSARFEPPMAEFGGDDAQAAAVTMNATLERMIAAAPAQFAWSTKIFRTRPPGEPKLYRRRSQEPLP